MPLIFIAFVAGMLTVLAPCILPLLPVIVGGSLLGGDEQKPLVRIRPYVIAASLAVSVIIFTLLLKATTALLGIPQVTWQIISGVIILLLGLQLTYPGIWEKISQKSGLFIGSNLALGRAYKLDGIWGMILIGVALGPVFNSCSPTYSLLVAAVLPQSFTSGLIYIFAYALGLASMLLLISLLGQKLVKKLGWLANPKGAFHKVIGVLFVSVGLLVIFGLDKKVQSFVLDQGWYDPIIKLEQKF
ncbi:MAG: cytochrome c biogenesis protein CcdA [Patescibacteria group bacterium]